VLNWGCGSGGECYIFYRNGADITAIDKSSNNINILLRTKILPEDRAIHGDGNAYLRTKQSNSHDLITAFMFSPYLSNPRWSKLLTNFYEESNRVIKPSGRILITSDRGTVKYIKKYLTGYVDSVDFRISEIEPALIGKKVNSVYFPSHPLHLA
jgi:SAM-dependent methyltransferase